MKEIQLTQGKVALIDDEDFDLVDQFKWTVVSKANKIFYAYRMPSRKLGKRAPILMHRFILGAEKGQQVDHVNGDGLDNRRENLRFSTQSENLQNMHAGRGSSKFKGVGWFESSGKWRAKTKFNGKYIHIGLFSSEIEAAKAYNEKALELFGEFACLNEIGG